MAPNLLQYVFIVAHHIVISHWRNGCNKYSCFVQHACASHVKHFFSSCSMQVATWFWLFFFPFSHLRHLILTSKMRMGCEALSFLLEQIGNCQLSYQLKDSVIESKRPFSNVILLCIYVFKYVSNGFRDYAIADPESLNNLIFSDMQMCEICVWHCWHRQWN